MPTLSQYSSLNDPDDLAEIEERQGFAASAAPGVVADFPFHATRIVTIAAGDTFLIKDLRQHPVLKLTPVLRGE
jgi:hypothetical protein